AIQLSQRNAEFLVVGFCTITQIAKRDFLTQLHRSIGIATPVNSGKDAMAKTDVACQLIELSVYGKLWFARGWDVRGRIHAVGRRHDQFRCREIVVAIEKELQDGDARASHRTVPGWVRRVGR